MSENLLHEVHTDFSGGVNQYAGSYLMADNELNKLQNGEYAQFGPVNKTKGYSQRGSDVKDGYEVLGMCNAISSDGTRRQIVTVDGASDSDCYTYNTITNAWTAHSLSLTVGAKAEFEYFLDGFFMVNFSDVTRWNDLTSWSTATNVTDAPKAKYIKQYQSRIYLAYVVDGGETIPSRVIYSDLPGGPPYTLTWNNAENYFDVDTEDGDVIKGLGMNANRLLLFKENSLHRYDTNTRYKVPGCPGTVSHRTIQNVQGYTFYLHSSGIWAYDGSSASLVSRQIKDIIGGMATKNFANACAFSSGDHYYLYVGDVSNTKAGVTINKCLVDFDVSKNAYSWRELKNEPTVFGIYRDDRSLTTYGDVTKTYNASDTSYNAIVTAEDRAYFGDSEGAVFQFNTGNTQNGLDIPFVLETKDYYLGNPSIFKLIKKVVVYCDGGKQVSIQYKIDDKEWENLGRLDSSQTELEFPIQTRGRKIRLRINESSSGDSFSFEGFDIYFNAEGLTE